MFSQWLHTALDFVFPAECQYCRAFLGDQRELLFCRECWESIAVIAEPTCRRCGDLLPIGATAFREPDLLCEHCRAKPPSMDRVLAAAYYEDVIKTAIHLFKFHQKIGLGKSLARLICSQLPRKLEITSYQAILPVPLHPRRQRRRGYNQSAILAGELSKMLDIPLLRQALRRIRPTHEQAQITDRQSRYTNIRNAFQVATPSSAAGKALILVDDVVTTGATVSECARMLKKSGAVSVLVLAVARRVLEAHDA